MYSCTYVNKYIEFHATISGFPSQVFFGASDRAPAMVLPGGRLVASLFAETVDLTSNLSWILTEQMGVSENSVPHFPTGFADHYPYEKWLFHWEYQPNIFRHTQMFDEALFIQFSWSLVNQEGNLPMFNHWSIYHCWGKRPFQVHFTQQPGGIHFAPKISGTAAFGCPKKKKNGGPCVAGVMFRPICPPSLIIDQSADQFVL